MKELQPDSDDEIGLLSWDFGMNGCEWTPGNLSDHGVTIPHMTFDSLESFNAWNESSGKLSLTYYDAAELCG